MSDLIPHLDHVIVGVKDQLDGAAARYRRLGFALLPRGHHTLGTSNHLAIFGDNYLELLGYEPERAREQAGNSRWQLPPGLIGLVFKPGDADSLPARLQERGFGGLETRSFSRPVSLPDERQADARFRTLNLPPQLLDQSTVFFCQHDTPEHVWREAWRQHPNGASDIVSFVIASADPALSAKPVVQLFGTQALTPVGGGLRLRAGAAEVLFLTPAEVQLRFHGLTPALETGRDRCVALRLRSRDLALTRRVLQQAGIEGLAEHGAELIVPADQAFGVALAFAA
jgi:hypothetical protein